MGVLDKHVPKKVKRVSKREKANIPWVNADVKAKLFKRDFLERKAIKTNKEEDWLLFKSSRNASNIALRHSKKEYYAKKFINNKQNPKKAWRTINHLLGPNGKHSTINEIKLPAGKTVASTDELVAF